MKKVITADNSETFVQKDFGESYHSHAGAVEEARRKYVIPCNIKELAKNGKLRILDVCFGLGYNSAMAISIALEENPGCEIEVVGLENDASILEMIQEVNPRIWFYDHYKKINPRKLEFREGKVHVQVLLGDARETVKKLNGDHFDAIFYDPFSPMNMPELWTEDLFREMWRVMKSSGILATYSCARLARENLSKAGFLYADGPIFGRRGPGTIATKWV